LSSSENPSTRRKESPEPTRNQEGASGLLADVKVVAHAGGAGIDTLEITVEDIVEIVEVVALSAWVVVGITNVHAAEPTIVLSHSLDEVATGGINARPQVTGTNVNVGLIREGERSAEPIKQTGDGTAMLTQGS
jgi:hypothetical protein